MEPTNQQLLGLYREMLRMRTVEQKLTELSRNGVLRGSLHLAQGQEALPAGACGALRKDDYLTVTYRGHGYVLAKGCDLTSVFSEILGRAGGLGKGKGGKMHLTDLSCGLLGANGIVGAGIPIATGAAMSAKLQKSGRVAMAVFGDGAVNQGVAHESFNMAGLYSLPVIYLCENNLYAEMTPLGRSSANHDLCVRMVAYNIEAVRIDGNDPVLVYQTVAKAAAKGRAGKGPTFIEAMTYRTCGHYQADAGTSYRTSAEIEEWADQSPIIRFEAVLKGKKIKFEGVSAEVEKEVEAAVRKALDSPPPASSDLLTDVFA